MTLSTRLAILTVALLALRPTAPLLAQNDTAEQLGESDESIGETEPTAEPHFGAPLAAVPPIDADTGRVLFEPHDSSEISPQLKSRREQDHLIRDLFLDAFLYRAEADWAFGVSYADYGHFPRRRETLNTERFERPYELDLHIDNEFRSGIGDDPREQLLRFAPPGLRWKMDPRFLADLGSDSADQHAAEWALRYWQGNRPMIHYNRAVSGRYGVLKLALVLPEELFDRQRREIRRAAAGVGFRPGYRAEDFNADFDPSAYTIFSGELSQDFWGDERGLLTSVTSWFEYAVEYAIMDVETAFDCRGADLAPMRLPGDAARDANRADAPDATAAASEPAFDTGPDSIDWLGLLERYWLYIGLVPLGVWLLLRGSSQKKQRRTHVPGQDRRL